VNGPRRDVFIVGSVVALLLLQAAFAGVSWFLHAATERELSDVTRHNADLQFEAARAAAQAAAPLAEPSRWQLLERADVAGTMQGIQDLADARGVVLDDVQAPPTRAAGKQSYRVTGTGTPHRLCSFLVALEQHERLLVVESGRVWPASGGQVGFELGIATFHRGGGQ